MASFSDQQSSYSYNSAATGSIYDIVGSTTTASVATITENEYDYNYGALGGVMAAYDYFTVTMTTNTYTGNWGT